MMNRPRRCDQAGTIHHVTLRGHNAGNIFCQDTDCESILKLLARQCNRCGGVLHAYCLMRNHIHIILSLKEDHSMGRIMMAVAGGHCRRMNRILGRRGTLWSQRFWSEPLEDNQRIATCHLYIESNPVRAGMVELPEQFQWSSYRTHAFGAESLSTTPCDWYMSLATTDASRQTRYHRMMSDYLNQWRVRRDSNTFT
jgi:putative transposase